MTFDYKKEHKEFYMPKNKPSIVKIPKWITIWYCLYNKNEL